MSRDHFIIWIYCLVCTYYESVTQVQPVRRAGGFAPKLTDAEVITMEICGEYFQLQTDKAIFDYFQYHYQHFFPRLTNRTLFVRQAANLWQIKSLIHQRVVESCGQHPADWQVIDTLPVPVCKTSRAKRSGFRQVEVDYGYCAAKREYYYEFKLGIRVSPLGMIVHYPLLPARPHDIPFLEELVCEFQGNLVGDKGFLDEWRRQQFLLQGVSVFTPPRRNIKNGNGWNDTFAQFRKRVETVGSQLTQQFGRQRLKLRSGWHLRHRIIRKVLSHTFCVFLNLQLHRPPLEIIGLVYS